MLRGGLFHRFWFRGALSWLIVHLFIGRVRLIGRERIPATGPVLFVGLHRAGMIDGLVYAYALPRQTRFMVAARLRRHWWIRLLVDGIEVVRRKDGGSARRNREALAACRAELAAGGTVFVFPEGTSSLGPKHLPFEPGAALIASSYPQPIVVPLAIHYVTPTRAGTDVEVVVGAPILLALRATPRDAVERIAAALEEVGIDFPDRVHQLEAEAAARAAWQRGAGYAEALRRYRDTAAARDPGRPVFVQLYGWVRSMLLAAVAVLNLPVAVAFLLAEYVLADDENVVLVWKVITSFTLELLWPPCVLLGLLWFGKFGLALTYIGLTSLYLVLPARIRGYA